MANSRYSYVRLHELPDPLLPTTFFVVRIDGKGFHQFSNAHGFEKPNDKKALDLMNLAAKRVMQGKEVMGDIVLSFGESDEYSKIVTLITSLFTSAYVYYWPQFFPNSPLQIDQLPVFDGRIVQYPSENEIKDYLRWRQVDTHINNLYNTCFWTLVNRGGLTNKEANLKLSGTVSAQKQELLFSQFGINYNNEAEMFKKGSILVWKDEDEVEDKIEREVVEIEREVEDDSTTNGTVGRVMSNDNESEVIRRTRGNKKKVKPKRSVVIIHEDLIKEEFWSNGVGRDLLET